MMKNIAFCGTELSKKYNLKLNEVLFALISRSIKGAFTYYIIK